MDGKGVLVAKDRTVTMRKNVFSLQPQSSTGMVAILNLENQQYLSADKGGGGKAVCNKPSVQGWEQWQITEVAGSPGKVHIISGSKGNYLSADKGGGGNVPCNRKKAGDWEAFVIVLAPKRLAGTPNDILDLVLAPPQQMQQPMQMQHQMQPMQQQYGMHHQQQMHPNQMQQHHHQQMHPNQMQMGNQMGGYQQPPPPMQQHQQASPIMPHAQPGSPALPPKPKGGSRHSGRGPQRVDDDLISFKDSDSTDLIKAKGSIQAYLRDVSALEDVFASHLRPGVSRQKSKLMGTMQGLVRGSSSSGLKLDRETKAEISRLSEPILRKFDLFMLDWNSYGRKLGQRSFSRIALLLGSFKEHMTQITSASVHSDTITETLSRLSTKFEKINVQIDQSFDYNNNSNVQADFDADQTIQGGRDEDYEFQDSDEVQVQDNGYD